MVLYGYADSLTLTQHRLVGTLFHVTDKERIYCWPDAYVNGHAVWHVLGAVGLYCVYTGMRAEVCNAPLWDRPSAHRS